MRNNVNIPKVLSVGLLESVLRVHIGTTSVWLFSAMAGHSMVKASGRLIFQAIQDQTRPNFKNFYYFPWNRGIFKNIVLNSPRNLGLDGSLTLTSMLWCVSTQQGWKSSIFHMLFRLVKCSPKSDQVFVVATQHLFLAIFITTFTYESCLKDSLLANSMLGMVKIGWKLTEMRWFRCLWGSFGGQHRKGLSVRRKFWNLFLHAPCHSLLRIM